MSSRRVALTASFLALAAGGAAACDSPEPEVVEYETVTSADDPYVEPESGPEPEDEDEDAYEDEVFYCADEEGTVVDEEYCDDGYTGAGTFLLWHSPSYSRDLRPGTLLDADGAYISPGDRAGRKSFGLPATGPVSNGTIKTGVVGKSGSGTGSSGG
ncbi:hypothetical protein AB0G04_39990 [Actinoplanes sp. NPDC023801]|uniref:hypothetical protein n=1 Tax=Actinoplanes sp. NPDC023801 TaxID=3154595 RepID=UPI00340A512B